MPRPEAIIPHRPPFLLVDEITEIVPDERATGFWHPTGDEAFFAGHFPDYPVVPGVLLIEALAQVGAVAAMAGETDADAIPFFGGIDKARFRRQVRPGERDRPRGRAHPAVQAGREGSGPGHRRRGAGL